MSSSDENFSEEDEDYVPEGQFISAMFHFVFSVKKETIKPEI